MNKIGTVSENSLDWVIYREVIENGNTVLVEQDGTGLVEFNADKWLSLQRYVPEEWYLRIGRVRLVVRLDALGNPAVYADAKHMAMIKSEEDYEEGLL